MKKMLIKALSVLLVVTILATSLPFTTFAAEENAENNQTISTDMGDMSMTATNSFGEMLTQSLSEQTDEQNNGYYISDIEYEGYCALVTFVTQQDCTIRVAVYEEDTGRMVTSASAEVLAIDTEVIVEFEDELPDYFVLKAFMLDDSVAPLCKAYTCNEMTKMYEDFIAATTEDFPEDKVVNLDEDEKNNFLVMSDDTTTITTDGATNVLLSYDAETGVYTFGNIDNQIKSLKKDDIFYFDNGNLEELTFIKVGVIDIDGTTAQITEAETSIEEVFDIVKIDNEMTSGEFAVDEDDELEDGVTYLGVEQIEETDDEVSTYAFDYSPSITFKHNYTLDKTVKPKEPKKITKDVSLTGSIKIQGTAGLSVKGTFKYYLSTEFSEVEFTLTPSISLKISLEGKGRIEVKLKALDYSPCVGVYVGISPKFIVEASVKATFDATLKFTLGFGYNTKDGLVNKTKKPSFKPEFKIEGEIFVGVDLAPRAYLIKEKFAKVELSSEIGAKLTAKISTNTGENHLCDSCLDGDIDFVGDLTGKFVIGEKTKLEKDVSVKFIDIKIDIVEFYYSYTYDEFGWDDCPYKNEDSEDDGDDSNEDDESENITDSGTCGDNLTWTFDGTTGTLTISGTGKMYDYEQGETPWKDVLVLDVKNVIISDGVTTIGNHAFDMGTFITDVQIPNSVKSIGEAAFWNCVYLKNLTIPTGVISIGVQAFAGCYMLESIVIPDSVTFIGAGAFYDCWRLQSVIIPNGVTELGEATFWNCYSLTLIVIPNSVTFIGPGAFYDCLNLKYVLYYGAEEQWEEINIYGADELLLNSNIYFISDDNISSAKGSCGENLTWRFDGLTGTLNISGTGAMDNYENTNQPWFLFSSEIKKVIIKNGTTSIGDDAFIYCTGLISVLIPDSVTTIGDRAFGECDSLTSVAIPDSVTTMGQMVFAMCDKLESVTIGNRMKTIDYATFFECTSLTDVRLGNSVATIGESAFLYCTSLTSITIPDSVGTIGDGAFLYCTSLTSITIPDSVTTMGQMVFARCDKLESVTIGNRVTTIDYATFFECTSLTDVILGNNVAIVGESAFMCCTSLTSITIPDSVTEIGDWAFYDCDSLTDVYYLGAEAQWNKISFGIDNVGLVNATIHYNSTGSTYSLRLNQVNIMSLSMKNTTDLTVYNATASNTISGNEYVIIVLKNQAGMNNFTDEDILYFDQKTAEAEDITFNYVPKTDDECIVYIIGIFSNSDSVKQEIITPEQTECKHSSTETIAGYAPTCTTTGLTAGVKCSKCNEILIAQQEISVTDHNYVDGNCVNCGAKDPSYTDVPQYNYTFSIQSPSRTEIRNKDGIILHANVDGTAPNGFYVKWESSNGNFDKSADGSNLKIIAKNKGYTTFTAILCDVDGNELARDNVEMYSKSGFFDKIGGFFRSLFGGTKIYEY